MYQVAGTNRKKYVLCSYGAIASGFPKTCDDGMLFDSSLKVCNFLDQVTCGDDPVCNPEPDASATGCEDIGGSECATPCADQSDGLYQVAGTNRKKYVLCSYGAVASGYPKTCDDGMLFDSSLKVCNYISQVTCGVSCSVFDLVERYYSFVTDLTNLFFLILSTTFLNDRMIPFVTQNQISQMLVVRILEAQSALLPVQVNLLAFTNFLDLIERSMLYAHMDQQLQ